MAAFHTGTHSATTCTSSACSNLPASTAQPLPPGATVILPFPALQGYFQGLFCDTRDPPIGGCLLPNHFESYALYKLKLV